MKFETEVKTTYKVSIGDVLQADAIDHAAQGLLPLASMALDHMTEVLGEEEFVDEWHTEVLRAAVEHVATYGSDFKDVRFYFGVWNRDGKNCVVHMADLEAYADEVTYNAWYAVVACEEVAWEVG